MTDDGLGYGIPPSRLVEFTSRPKLIESDGRASRFRVAHAFSDGETMRVSLFDKSGAERLYEGTGGFFPDRVTDQDGELTPEAVATGWRETRAGGAK